MNNIMRCLLLIVVFGNFSFAQNKDNLFSGFVKDTDGINLPHCTIRVFGTTFGTMCNKDGKFQIVLPTGEYTFVFSYVGYKSKSFHIQLEHDTDVVINLHASEIRLPGVEISGEDPAYQIIRDAIQTKIDWQKNIKSFKARVYTKDTFGSDTLLMLISEAYSDLFWQKNDSLKEVVVYRRQTEMVPDELQFAIVRDFLDFNQETIQYWGYTFIAPLSESAFKYYDYKLLKTYIDNDKQFFEIEVIPLSKTEPLFSGNITIADSTFFLQKVKLQPSSIFQMPLLKLNKLEFTQQFGLYENRFPFPLEYHISMVMNAGFMSDTSQKAFYNKSVICFEYQINPKLHDSVKSLPSLSLLSSHSQNDTSLWKNVTIYPLSNLEKKSYSIIKERIQRKNFNSSVISFLLKNRKIIEIIDARYNRVEGLFIGGKTSYTTNSRFRISSKIGYGISDKNVKYSIQPELLISTSLSAWVGVEQYQLINTFPINYKIPGSTNSFFSFFNGEDYYNYFLRNGRRAFISFEKYSSFNAKLSYVEEDHHSILKNTDFALNHIVGKNKKFRLNPSISEGGLHSFQLDLFNVQMPKNIFFENHQDIWNVGIEYSSSTFGSNYDFTLFNSNISLRIPTMGTSLRFHPYLSISSSVGFSTGLPPFQRIFAFETPVLSIASPNSYRTILHTEFTGDNFYTFSVEHNFRNIPFLIIGLSSFNFDIIFRASTGKIWTNSEQLKNLTNSTQGFYSEYTFGIGRLMDFLRIDFTYSNYQQSRFAVTLIGGIQIE